MVNIKKLVKSMLNIDDFPLVDNTSWIESAFERYSLSCAGVIPSVDAASPKQRNIVMKQKRIIVLFIVCPLDKQFCSYVLTIARKIYIVK